MAKLPIDTRLKIQKAIEDGFIIQKPRPYLGLSGIGEKCGRKLWYGFRMCSVSKITQRQHRLFQRGHKEEPIIQADLRKVGIWHHDDQLEIVTGHGHIKGHIDDLLDYVLDAPKTTHLGEYKTHNDKSFKDLKKRGMKTSKPMHHAQMICYMKELKLKRGLYIAVNKNDDERYYERISSDDAKAKEFIQRGVDIIASENLPMRIGNSTWFECKWCNHYELCHFGNAPLKNCRTCQAGDIHDHGVWGCSLHKINLTFEQQLSGCDEYNILNTLNRG